MKTKKSILNFDDYLSFLKISRKSIDPSPRNLPDKIGKKKIIITRHDLVASNEEVSRPMGP